MVAAQVECGSKEACPSSRGLVRSSIIPYKCCSTLPQPGDIGEWLPHVTPPGSCSPLEGHCEVPAQGSVTVHTSPLSLAQGGSVITHCSPPEGQLGRSSGRTPSSRYGHMLPTRRDSSRPSRISSKDALAQAFTLKRGASLGQPQHRGRILTNPSIPALRNRADRGRTFPLAPIEGSSSTETREMLGSHTQGRGNGTTPTAAVAPCVSSVAWTPGRLQQQPLPRAIRAGHSLYHRQGKLAVGPAVPLGLTMPATSLPKGHMPPSHPASSRDVRLP